MISHFDFRVQGVNISAIAVFQQVISALASRMSKKTKKEKNWPKDEAHWNTWLPRKYGKWIQLIPLYMFVVWERSGAEIGLNERR